MKYVHMLTLIALSSVNGIPMSNGSPMSNGIPNALTNMLIAATTPAPSPAISTSTLPSPTGSDPRRVVLPDGRVCFDTLIETEDGPELVTTCPKTRKMVSLWDKQAKKALKAGNPVTLATQAPTGCTCGKSGGTPVAPSCGPDEVAAERKIIEEALARVIAELKKKFPGIGNGWWGNVTGSGPKCNEVFEAFTDLWQKEMDFLKGKLKCLQMATLLDFGKLPFELQAHIACGVLSKDTKELLWVIDPWRYGSCNLVDPRTCPNSWDEINPWPNY